MSEQSTTLHSIDFGTAEKSVACGPAPATNMPCQSFHPSAACSRQRFCIKCRRYAHGDCLNRGLCQKCHDEQSTTKTWWTVHRCPLLAIFAMCGVCGIALLGAFTGNMVILITILSPVILFYVFFFLMGPPYGIYHALCILPERRKVDLEYLQHGMNIDGVVTRRWTYEVSDADNGTRSIHQCSIAYSFPEETGTSVYRLEFVRRLPFPDSKWSEMHEGSNVQLVALEGCPKSARISGTINPWTSTGLRIRQASLFLVCFGCMMVLPILVAIPFFQTKRWIFVVVFCILGLQLTAILFLCMNFFTVNTTKSRTELREKLSSAHSSCCKAGDLSSPEPNPRATTA